MKYNININQIILAKTDLDIIDGAILDYLYYLCSSRSEKVEKHRVNGFTWVNFSYLLEEMPLLRIKAKSRISERIRKIALTGYILTWREGNKLYVKMSGKVDELFVKTNDLSPAFVKTNGSVLQNERSVPVTVRQNEHNHYTNDHNTKPNVNVDFQNGDNFLTDTMQGQLEYQLQKIKELKNKKAWLEVIRQIGFQKTIEILIDVGESGTAKNKGACAMGLAKKAGFKKFF
ncbi:MAG: hypothetical protein V1867_00925 [Candidatus Falkowbacteria bacterium]